MCAVFPRASPTTTVVHVEGSSIHDEKPGSFSLNSPVPFDIP